MLDGDQEMIRAMKERLIRRQERDEEETAVVDHDDTKQLVHTKDEKVILPSLTPPVSPAQPSTVSPTSTIANSYHDMREVIASTVPQVWHSHFFSLLLLSLIMIMIIIMSMSMLTSSTLCFLLLLFIYSSLPYSSSFSPYLTLPLL